MYAYAIDRNLQQKASPWYCWLGNRDEGRRAHAWMRTEARTLRQEQDKFDAFVQAAHIHAMPCMLLYCCMEPVYDSNFLHRKITSFFTSFDVVAREHMTLKPGILVA
jgi:hypothetical protein